MVETYVPFLLILMSWNADDPQGTMRVSQELYISEADCVDAGKERQQLVEEDKDQTRQFAWKCTRHTNMIQKFSPLRNPS